MSKKAIYSKYFISIILPTYQERENLPIILYMIMKMADEK
jgi:hypothetical protein